MADMPGLLLDQVDMIRRRLSARPSGQLNRAS